MNIGDLKGWLLSIPDDFNDMAVLYRRYEVPEKEDENTESELFYAVDVPIVSGFIDQENRECCFFDDKSRAFIIDMNKKLNELNNEKLPNTQ